MRHSVPQSIFLKKKASERDSGEAQSLCAEGKAFAEKASGKALRRSHVEFIAHSDLTYKIEDLPALPQHPEQQNHFLQAEAWRGYMEHAANRWSHTAHCHKE